MHIVGAVRFSNAATFAREWPSVTCRNAVKLRRRNWLWIIAASELSARLGCLRRFSSGAVEWPVIESVVIVIVVLHAIAGSARG